MQQVLNIPLNKINSRNADVKIVDDMATDMVMVEIHFCLEMALNRKAIPISTPHKHLIKKESFFGSTSLAGNSTCRYCVHISFQHDPSKMVILDYINMPSPQHSDILIRNLPNARALRHHLK